MIKYRWITEGEKFFRWNGETYIFDPKFDGVDHEGINAWEGTEVIGSITWSEEDDYTFLRTAYVSPDHRRKGVFHQMFDLMVANTDDKPVKGQWRTGGPLELFMASWNEQWREE